MTAAQTTLSQKASHPMSGPIAVVAASLMIAVIGVAIVARPVAAPASPRRRRHASVRRTSRPTFVVLAMPLTFGPSADKAGRVRNVGSGSTPRTTLEPEEEDRGGRSDRGGSLQCEYQQGLPWTAR